MTTTLATTTPCPDCMAELWDWPAIQAHVCLACGCYSLKSDGGFTTLKPPLWTWGDPLSDLADDYVAAAETYAEVLDTRLRRLRKIKGYTPPATPHPALMDALLRVLTKRSGPDGLRRQADVYCEALLAFETALRRRLTVKSVPVTRKILRARLRQPRLPS